LGGNGAIFGFISVLSKNGDFSAGQEWITAVENFTPEQPTGRISISGRAPLITENDIYMDGNIYK